MPVVAGKMIGGGRRTTVSYRRQLEIKKNRGNEISLHMMKTRMKEWTYQVGIVRLGLGYGWVGFKATVANGVLSHRSTTRSKATIHESIITIASLLSLVSQPTLH